jgi:hypothetical protein
VLDKRSTERASDQRGGGFSRPRDFRNIPNRAGGDAADIGAVEIPIAPPGFSSTNPASPSGDDTPMIRGGAQTEPCGSIPTRAAPNRPAPRPTTRTSP